MATVTIEIPDEFLHQFQQLGDRFPEWLALFFFRLLIQTYRAERLSFIANPALLEQVQRSPIHLK